MGALSKFRKQNTAMPVSLAQIKAMSQKETLKFLEAERPKMMAEIGDLVVTVACEVLNLEFGFGKERLKKFGDRMVNVLECRADGLVTVADIKEHFKKLYGIEVGLDGTKYEK
jgi:hypothetical protein